MYTQTFQMNRDLTADEFEDIGADIRRIVSVAATRGIELCGLEEDEPVVINGELVCFNGVGEESHEAFLLRRRIPQLKYHDPIYNFCKTSRNNYDPVVGASIMALKQRVPQDVMVSGDGDWGYEWLHGAGCWRERRKSRRNVCANKDPGHIGLSGRELYRLSFPDSPEPMNVFRSPLVGTEHEGQYIYIGRELACERRGSGFEGVPFGVSVETLLEQSKRRKEAVCMICGEASDTEIKTRNQSHYTLKGPMCLFCYRERLLGGKMLGYRFAENPYRIDYAA